MLSRTRVLSLFVSTLAAGSGITPTVAAPFELTFFSGASEGCGTMKLPFGSRQVHVRSAGRLTADGTLILDQTVTMGRKPARQRQWRMQEVAPGHFSGSLSDAAGPVSGDRIGDALRLRYHFTGGVAAEQRLELASGGPSAHNHMTVHKFGIVMARLDEVIHRLD